MMMPQIKDMISLKLKGSSIEYFNCSDTRLNRIEAMIKSLPNKRAQFVEIDKCQFEYLYES